MLPPGISPDSDFNPTACGLAWLLQQQRYNYTCERDVQDGIESYLTREGFFFLREHRLSGKDIVDFMVGGVAVEVKVKSNPDSVHRQLLRYAEHECVKELLLVTTVAKHRSIRWEQSKPLKILWLAGSIF